MLGAELTTGHEVALSITAAVFITFALVSSFVVPRFKPDYPGPNGIGVFVVASVVVFALMVAAINFFG